jgi:hypothetical protein
MSLNWNAQGVRELEKIDEEGMRGVMDALIWGTIIVGMGRISGEEKDPCSWKRFHARLSFAQKINGPFLYAPSRKEGGRRKEVEITEEMVKRFIGLTTNVSYETPTRWLSRFLLPEKRNF